MGRMGRMGVSLSMELIFSELCEFSVKYWFCVGCGGFEEGSKRDRRRVVEGRILELKMENYGCHDMATHRTEEKWRKKEKNGVLGLQRCCSLREKMA